VTATGVRGLLAVLNLEFEPAGVVMGAGFIRSSGRAAAEALGRKHQPSRSSTRRTKVPSATLGGV
jgi:hypothetical protein